MHPWNIWILWHDDVLDNTAGLLNIQQILNWAAEKLKPKYGLKQKLSQNQKEFGNEKTS